MPHPPERFIGRIDWFGGIRGDGRHNNYGFITEWNNAQENIFLHRDKILDRPEDYENKDNPPLVTFEIFKGRDGRFSAANVQLFENDPSGPSLAAQSPLSRYWRSYVDDYFATLLDDASRQEFLLLKFTQVQAEIQRYRYPFTSIHQSLIPLAEACNLASRDYRKFLPKRNHFDLVLADVKRVGVATQEEQQELIETIDAQTDQAEMVFFEVRPYLDLSDATLRQKLPAIFHLHALLSIIKSSNSSEDLLEELAQLLMKHQSFWDEVDDGFLTQERLWQIAPRNKKLKFLELQLSYKNAADTLLTSRLKTLLTSPITDDELRGLEAGIAEHPDALTLAVPFLSRFSPRYQVEALWVQLRASDRSAWLSLSREARVLAIYRGLATGSPLLGDFEDGNDPIATSLYKLSLTKGKPDESSMYFKQLHIEFEKEITDLAFRGASPLRYPSLLPNCGIFESLSCEGRPWNGKPDAWCGRLRHGCPPNLVLETDETARIAAQMNRLWYAWSLLEFFDAIGYVATFPGPSTSNRSVALFSGEYVNQLAGWVNRMNELREILKCTVCSKPHLMNAGYARNLAAYRSTVSYCPEKHEQPTYKGLPHQEMIYVSHCRGRGCGRLIDSRKSPIKDDLGEYYLCIHCGTGGPQHISGSCCPKCGSRSLTARGRDRSCNTCTHKHRVPH